MGFSNSYVESLRKRCRGVILPTQEICTILESTFDLSAPRTIADFGAGTLYFSEYFARAMGDCATANDISMGGGQITKDSACSDKGLIASRLLRLRTPSARPCKHSQNKPFSSTILESQSSTEAQSLDSSSTILESQAIDKNPTPRIHLAQNAQSLGDSQAVGFCDDFLKKLRFVGCQGVGEGIYLSGNEQTHATDSRKSAQKPTPTPNDSKNCGGAGVALHTFGGRSYLGGNDYPPNVCNQSHCPPKAESPKGKVVAIDSIYTTLTPTTTYPTITLESSLDSALSRYDFDLFFASDVLHHLSQDFTQKLLESIAHIPIIIIKDIDSRHLLGHYANALHDLVFNQEKVCKVYPNKLESILQSKGYTTRYHYLPKLWYPHFLLLAYKSDQVAPATIKDTNEPNSPHK